MPPEDIFYGRIPLDFLKKEGENIVGGTVFFLVKPV